VTVLSHVVVLMDGGKCSAGFGSSLLCAPEMECRDHCRPIPSAEIHNSWSELPGSVGFAAGFVSLPMRPPESTSGPEGSSSSFGRHDPAPWIGVGCDHVCP